MTEWRNRIVGSGTKRAGEFLANPHNWRVHPAAQQEALEGALDAVGWVAQVIENARTGHVVDGHQRILSALKQGEDVPVPVLYVDLSEEEERLVLAVLDPIGAMAGQDRDVLRELLDSLPPINTALTPLVSTLAAEVGAMTPVEDLFREQAERFAVTLTFSSRETYQRAVEWLAPSGHVPPGSRCTLSGENALARALEGRADV